MYDYDCTDEEQFTEETLQEGLRQLITDGCDSLEICWENLRVQTFAEAGLMTRDCGLVITLPRRQRVPADHRPKPLSNQIEQGGTRHEAHRV